MKGVRLLDVAKLGELVAEFNPLVLIANNNGSIIWISKKMEKEFNIACLKKIILKIYSIFLFEI